MTSLERLFHYWGCASPLNFVCKLTAHIARNNAYYRQFETVKDLFSAVEKRVIHGRMWSEDHGKWVVFS